MDIKKSKVKIKPPAGISEEDWDMACECAWHELYREVINEYVGLDPVGPECITLALRSGFSDALYSQAMMSQIRAFDYVAAHHECVELQQRGERNAARMSMRTARLRATHCEAWSRGETDCILSHHRYQLPVGQGGFHVGTLEKLDQDKDAWRESLSGDAITSADFLYVYDCGSIPRKGVDDAVRSIVKRRPCQSLNMLFVSHFDRDHICGIPTLLCKNVGLSVDTIIMPYLDHVDRIIAFARCADEFSDDKSEKFFRDIVVDPVERMRRFKPKEIILIMPLDEDSAPTPDEPSARTRLDPTRFSISMEVARSASIGATLKQNWDSHGNSDINGKWLLKTFVKRATKRDREAFCGAVEYTLGWPRGHFYKKVQAKAERRRLVTERREALSHAYAWAFGNKNETSLSLYSGPTEPHKAGAVSKDLCDFHTARVGWLGTGDAGLKEKRAIEDFKNHFQDELDWVTTFMLPHHGSAHNYDPSISVVNAELFVAAAYPNNPKWKHPAAEIVKAIKASGANFQQVGLCPKTRLEEKMVLFWSK
jgi:hypothetical protein